MSEFEGRNQPDKELNFSLTLDVSAFSQGIQDNFRIIWEAMQKQSAQIQYLKEKIVYSPERYSREMHRNDSQNDSLVYSERSGQSPQMNPEAVMLRKMSSESPEIKRGLALLETKAISTVEEQPSCIQAAEESTVREINQTQPDQSAQPAQPTKAAEEDFVQKNPQNRQNPQQPEQSGGQGKEQSSSRLENKIFQLNERLQRLQLSAVKEIGITSRKFNSVQGEIDRVIEQIGKKFNDQKRFEKEIETFKTELAVFKIKKQSQIMRMSALSNSTGKDSQPNEYIMDKIQQIVLFCQTLASADQLEALEDKISSQNDKLQKKINQFVTAQQFNDTVSILKKQIKGKSRIPRSPHETDTVGNEQTEGQSLEIDLLVRIQECEKHLKLLAQDYQTGKTEKDIADDELSNIIRELKKQLTQIKMQESKNEFQIDQMQNYMKEMGNSYSSKFKQVQEQLIDAQESIEKLNNQIKFYNFTAQSQTSAASVANPSNHQSPIEPQKMSSMESDITTLKKRVNKFGMKVQSLNDDIGNLKQEMKREIDGMKSQLNKKADWQGLKKGFAYFEDKIKEIQVVINTLQTNIVVEDNEESTAAKKGWTCLCCDKDIKKFEGRLSQAKFTSVFPARYESPRIGGYYKNREADKQYKQLYLPKAHQRRLSQIHQSKEQI